MYYDIWVHIVYGVQLVSITDRCMSVVYILSQNLQNTSVIQSQYFTVRSFSCARFCRYPNLVSDSVIMCQIHYKSACQSSGVPTFIVTSDIPLYIPVCNHIAFRHIMLCNWWHIPSNWLVDLPSFHPTTSIFPYIGHSSWPCNGGVQSILCDLLLHLIQHWNVFQLRTFKLY